MPVNEHPRQAHNAALQQKDEGFKRSLLMHLPQWHALQQHYQQWHSLHLKTLFIDDPQRFQHFSLNVADVLLDYSKNHVTHETLRLLTDLAMARNVPQALRELNSGGLINFSEQRAALHSLLRAVQPSAEINAALAHMESWITQLHQSQFTDIVNIGIGGSDLGPVMVAQALKSFAVTTQRLHFISTLDATQISETLKYLRPETTLFIVSSKSFTTEETLVNATVAKQWLGEKRWPAQAVAVTANANAAKDFGITTIFPLWEWVGGRYSVWSAIGLPVAIKIGMPNFRQFLAGANAMDQHALTAPLAQNMPAILALLNVWYTNFFQAQTHAVLPYDYRLARLPAYLQQLEMESNGKCVTQTGVPVDYQTGPIIWGELETNGQHAFHQLLHQGTQFVPVDFVVACRPAHSLSDQHTRLFAHALSQARALLYGRDNNAELPPYQQMPGNRPSNMLVLRELTPFTLGALIALYEYKVFISAVIWDINPFDQWGVELGKQLAKQIYQQLSEHHIDDNNDSSTRGLMEFYLRACLKSPRRN